MKNIEKITLPSEALKIMKDGNERFVKNVSINRNLMEDAVVTSEGQSPIAVVLTCLDSRSSADIIFDQPIGGVFSARVAGNIVNDDILGSMEFACVLSTARLIMVIGHSSCGAVEGAIGPPDGTDEIEMCNLKNLLKKIVPAIDSVVRPELPELRNNENTHFVNKVIKENVILTMEDIKKRSETLRNLDKNGDIMIVGGVHNLSDGTIKYINKD
jgi:carbonic anhydrase|tara:strand:- start:796 stop:1437 length:642 start_codon:yes stop_codon:yes gene_type:complete